MEELNRIGHDIIGCAFEVRRMCGKYLLESFYEAALAYELRGQRIFPVGDHYVGE